MAATTTPSIDSVIAKLAERYPMLTLVPATQFSWQPQSQTITYRIDGSVSELLHEIGHAQRQHHDVQRDIELLRYEREAWQTAETIATQLDLVLDDELIDRHLDSYRDWMHQRSTCPNCQQTGIETKRHHYQCAVCQTTWRVNDARQCGLKRTRLTAS